ncbi:YlbD family protein [Neobacillus cucumis]|uniref:YlbD family protein n=1 Tax=Neobacillus cucumis TaxID=1740721 RepID=UPI0018DFB296|nr:YlbD family protein [Neobacillus cucumis]MBI0578367.1 YlbD family protein [Neobacillus cucumis]WHY93477.1 YlbD family protein [Neobacillus cucumis]
MAQKKLHPSVAKFKEFVKNNPKMIQEVRKGKTTWQELYEDWYLLGEEDARWEKIGNDKNDLSEKTEEQETNTEKKGDLISNIMGMVNKMDPNQIQNHINNLSQAIGAIQGVLSQFQGSNGAKPPGKPQEGPINPFTFRKD